MRFIAMTMMAAVCAFGVYALDMYTGSELEPTYVQPQLCLTAIDVAAAGAAL